MATERLKKAADELTSNGFATVWEYERQIAAGRVVRKPLLVDDAQFQQDHPEHPLARDNRFARIDAAGELLDLARSDPSTFSPAVMNKLHLAVFDCCAAVRESLAKALFFIGDPASLKTLQTLVDREAESRLVRRAAVMAAERIQTLKNPPADVKRCVVVASDDFRLLDELYGAAYELDGHVLLASPDTPDVIVYGGCVKVIDREFLGRKAWESFCAYLRECNEPVGDGPDEEVAAWLQDIGPDETPLLIIDNASEDFSQPEAAAGEVVWMGKSAACLIASVAQQTLRGEDIDLCAAVDGVNRRHSC